MICTELCGLGHALMRSHVTILTRRETSTTWLKSGGKPTAGPPGLAVFQQNGCGSCHTLQPAGATGKIGPDLDNLKQQATQANRGPLEAFIRSRSSKPAAYIAPGYSDLMPHDLRHADPARQLEPARAVSCRERQVT